MLLNWCLRVEQKESVAQQAIQIGSYSPAFYNRSHLWGLLVEAKLPALQEGILTPLLASQLAKFSLFYFRNNTGANLLTYFLTCSNVNRYRIVFKRRQRYPSVKLFRATTRMVDALAVHNVTVERSDSGSAPRWPHRGTAKTRASGSRASVFPTG